ncbi:sensor histidine kinase [Salinarimonas sp. NSM]|uniref:sensor histidine kinase n=1 Tax=Salinarimonas sp. NSM TaxID=3458003 RepID=UPI004035C336
MSRPPVRPAMIRRRRVALVALLILACGVFIAATAGVYVRQIEQKALLTETIRASGWTAYQAKLEHVRSLAALELAAHAPSPAGLSEATLRLEILLSRLPLITTSDEGDFLSSLPGVPELAARMEAEVAAVADEVYAADFDEPGIRARLDGWRARIAAFEVPLQEMLQQTVAYNERLFRRESELSEATAILPLGSLVISGAILVGLLIVQVRRAEHGLDEMRAARAEAAENEASLRRMIEAAPVAFVVADPHTDAAVFINASAAGLVADDPRDGAWRAAIGQCRRAVGARGALARRPSDPAVPVTLRHPGGWLMSCTVLHSRIVWNGREQSLYALVETTRSRSAEREAMQASTLATVGEMAAAIVHEINQPLATMKMASSNALALLDEGAPAEKLRPKLARIDAQVDRARRITDQIRRLVRRGDDRPHPPFSPPEAIERAVGAVAEQYQRAGITLSIRVEDARGSFVAGDPTLFEQVLVNLLVNAHDAFGPPERRAAGTPEPRVRVRAQVEEGMLVVEVHDNAGGLPPEIAERLFEPFVTTKPAGEGTGLGLALARKIVADMGGRVGADTVAGGALFDVRLPLATPARAAAAA